MTWTLSTPQVGFLTLLALSPQLPAGCADVLATAEPAVQAALVANPACPDPVRRQLARRGAAHVRAAALAASADPGLLEAAATGCRREQLAVAANPATPAPVLAAQARAAEPDLAAALLTNPALDPVLAAGLSGRFFVGQLVSPGRPLGSSQGSAVWRALGVATMLTAQPGTAAQWFPDPDPTTARVLAYSPHLDPALARAIVAARPGGATLAALAANPWLDPQLVDQLRAPGAVAARQRLREVLGVGADAQMPAAVAALLGSDAGQVRLAGSGSRTLEWVLATHPGLGRAAASALATQRAEQPLEAHVMAALANRCGPAVAGELATHQNTSRLTAAATRSPVLRAMLSHPRGRYAAAGAVLDAVAALGAELVGHEQAWPVVVGLLRAGGDEVAPADLATVARGVAAPAGGA